MLPIRKKFSDRPLFQKGAPGCRAGSPAKKCQKRDGARYPWTGTQKSTAPAYRILHPFVERMLFVRRKSFRIDPFFKRGRRVAGRGALRKVSKKGRYPESIDRHPKNNGAGIPGSLPFPKKYVAHPQIKFSERPLFQKGSPGCRTGDLRKVYEQGQGGESRKEYRGLCEKLTGQRNQRQRIGLSAKNLRKARYWMVYFSVPKTRSSVIPKSPLASAFSKLLKVIEETVLPPRSKVINSLVLWR